MRFTFVISTAVVAAAALSAGLLSAAPAGAGPSRLTSAPVAARAATTTLGQISGTLAVCNATPSVPAAALLATEGANAASYIAPTNGVLVSFSHRAGSSAGQVRAIVFANGQTDNQKLVVAKGPKQTVTVSITNTFPIRLPIKAGQRLGLGYTTKQTACLNAGVTGDSTSFASPFDPDTSSDFFTQGSFVGAYRPNISAVLEPDVDNDGYGDITQDACPQSALSQVACPTPDTKLTKKPKKHLTRHRIKLKFISTVTGSTFECSRDGHRFKPCTSPYKRRFGPGRHKLLVQAVSPAGIADDKPAKVKFTVVRRG